MNEISNVAALAAAGIDASALKAALHDGYEIALLDVREHGQYGEGHIFLAVPVPYSRLESLTGVLVPRRGTRIVVYDDGPGGASDGVARLAALRLCAIGYSDVRVLEGGVATWLASGYSIFAGVNVPSKTFGELLEEQFVTPHISARDLNQRLARGENLVLLDGRPVEEYRKMSLPTATCCPNGELALRASAIAPDPDTTIVVNCAGRTRSIVGAQTLIDMGFPNPVYALENGTQGWFLEDLALDYGADRLYPQPALQSLSTLQARARAFAVRWDVPFVDAAQVVDWREDVQRTTFLFDVRTPEEFASGSLPGAVHAPGGQLVQATDQFVGTRGARLVLFDNEAVRAPVIAARLRQMGWDAAVLIEGVLSRLTPSIRGEPLPEAQLALLTAAELASLEGATMLDLRSSFAHRTLHPKGATWTIRPRMASLDLPPGRPVVLIVDSPDTAYMASVDLVDLGVSEVLFHLADPSGWAAVGIITEATPDQPPDAECIDYLFFVHDRHDGNKEAARKYLAWELGLLAQLDEQERALFRI